MCVHAWNDSDQLQFHTVSGFSVAASLAPLTICFFFPPRPLGRIKVCFAANLPNTMLTPPVMRSLLCISQISRGMSLRAYTFNWLRQASSHVIWNKDSWVFSEGHDFWTTYLTSSNKILLSFGWINKRVSHWGYSLMRNHLFGFYNSQPLWAAVIDANQCLYST